MEDNTTTIKHTSDRTLSTSAMERLERISDRRETIRQAARAPRTLDAYRSDWDGFRTWAVSLGVTNIPEDPERLADPIPIGIVEAYVLERSDEDGPAPLSPASIARHLSALKWWHRTAMLQSPTDAPQVSDLLAGIKRTANRKTRQVRPLFLDELQAALEPLGSDPKSVRDRALLLVGWWSALRRSELVAINTSDLAEHPEGLILTIRRSKTDQDGRGRQVALHYHEEAVCPVRAIRRWLDALEEGPVFRRVDRWGTVHNGPLHNSTVARIVKEAAERIGIPASSVSGHSLRAGFVSECDRRRIPSGAVRAVTGHTTEAMLSVYARPGDLFDTSAGAYF